MNWTNWRRFPGPHGGPIDAPASPGLYEVCHIATGEVVALGVASNLAQALVNAVRPPLGRSWPFVRKTEKLGHPVEEMEFRICATESLSEARKAMHQIDGRRDAARRRHAFRRAS